MDVGAGRGAKVTSADSFILLPNETPPPTVEFLYRECFFFRPFSFLFPSPFHVLLTLTFTNDIFVSEDTNTMR